MVIPLFRKGKTWQWSGVRNAVAIAARDVMHRWRRTRGHSAEALKQAG